MLSVSIAAVALGLAATPAAARTPTDQKGTAAEKKICRWIEPRTGSNFRERVCLTAEQWKKVEELDW